MWGAEGDLVGGDGDWGCGKSGGYGGRRGGVVRGLGRGVGLGGGGEWRKRGVRKVGSKGVNLIDIATIT